MSDNIAVQSGTFIEWREIKGKTCLFFIFNGVFKLSDAEPAIEKWKECFKTRKGEKITIVWHCLKMKGYEPLARVAWQKTIKELKDQIGTIWLISDSSLIQAGARVISMFTSFEIKTVKSEDAIIP